MIEKELDKAEWQKVKCDCCGEKVLAYIHAGRLTIYGDFKGTRHTAVILLADLTSLELSDTNKTTEY